MHVDFAYFTLQNMQVSKGDLSSIADFKMLLKLVKPVEVVAVHAESRHALIQLCKREQQPLVSFMSASEYSINSLDSLVESYMRRMFLDELLSIATYRKSTVRQDSGNVMDSTTVDHLELL